MKKVLTMFFAFLLFIFSAPTQILAVEETEDDISKKLTEAYAAYLDSHGISSSIDLTTDQSKELARILHEIKLTDPEIAELEEPEQSARAVVTRAYKGNIFVTGDAQTSSFKHGHAGIGSAEVDQVIEANPGVGVKLYKKRVSGYWSQRNASILKVKDATSSHYQKAYSWASSQKGKPYGIQWDYTEDKYYCSSLVHISWMKAGKNLTGAAGGYVLPVDLYGSRYTYATVVYNKGF